MRGVQRVLTALPSFLVGVAAATAAELSASLLLFPEEGFLPAVTLVLTLETLALGLGLWARPFPPPGGEVEELRRSWFFTLVVFTVAAIFSAGLILGEDGSRTGLGQGLGLALLGCLPLFAAGSLLGAMGRWYDGGSALAGVGGPGVLGGAVGFLVTGSYFLPGLAPYTTFVLCLVFLSGGALLHGLVLEFRTLAVLRESVSSPLGEIRVEDRVGGSPRRELRILTQAGRVRGAEDWEGNPGRAWEGAVLTALRGDVGTSDGLLYLGGGSGTLARLLKSAYPQLSVQVVERTRELVEVARRSLQPWEDWESYPFHYGDPFSVLPRLDGTFRVVVVDVQILPFLGHLPLLEEDHWTALRDAAGNRGSVVLGGLPVGLPEGPAPLAALRELAHRWFPGVGVYVRERPGGPADPPFPGEGEAEAFLLLGGAEAPAWPATLADFRARGPEGE